MAPQHAFGIVLKRLRHARALTQEDLAFESGVARTFIARMEAGRHQPTLTTVFRLAAALGLGPEEVVAEVAREVAAAGSDERAGPGARRGAADGR